MMAIGSWRSHYLKHWSPHLFCMYSLFLSGVLAYPNVHYSRTFTPLKGHFQDMTTHRSTSSFCTHIHTHAKSSHQKQELSDMGLAGTCTTRRHILLLAARTWYREGEVVFRLSELRWPYTPLLQQHKASKNTLRFRGKVCTSAIPRLI